MSISTIDQVISRIETSTVHSPISVFRVKTKELSTKKDKVFQTYFGATLATLDRIKNNGPDYVGTYDITTGVKRLDQGFEPGNSDHAVDFGLDQIRSELESIVLLPN